MMILPFDTLKMARKLESAGFSPTQAAGTAEAMADVLSVADLATKSDVKRVETELERVETSLRQEIKAEAAQLRQELKSEASQLRHDMELLRRDLTIRLGGMMIGGFTIMLGAMRYMLVHP
jgi:TolA-binding protein